MVQYSPPPHFISATLSGQKTQMRIPFHNNDGMRVHAKMCQFLIKMGLELISESGDGEIYEKKYDAAREFSRRKGITGKWFYIHIVRLGNLLGIKPEISISIHKDERNNGSSLLFNYFGNSFLCPLVEYFDVDVEGFSSLKGEHQIIDIYKIRGGSVSLRSIAHDR